MSRYQGIIAYHFPTLAHIAVSKDSSTSAVRSSLTALTHPFSIFGSQEKTKMCADQRKDNGKYRNIYRTPLKSDPRHLKRINHFIECFGHQPANLQDWSISISRAANFFNLTAIAIALVIKEPSVVLPKRKAK